MVKLLCNIGLVNFDAFLKWCVIKKACLCAACVCACVREQSFGIAWRPVGNADSICGGLGLADQMVFMIGSNQFQGDLTHRKTGVKQCVHLCLRYVNMNLSV